MIFSKKLVSICLALSLVSVTTSVKAVNWSNLLAKFQTINALRVVGVTVATGIWSERLDDRRDKQLNEIKELEKFIQKTGFYFIRHILCITPPISPFDHLVDKSLVPLIFATALIATPLESAIGFVVGTGGSWIRRKIHERNKQKNSPESVA